MLPEYANATEQADHIPAKWRAAKGRCECIRTREEECAKCAVGEEDGGRLRQLKTPESADFEDLGPPPPCCPVLCRQKATDFSEARERKRLFVDQDEFAPVPKLNRRLPTLTMRQV